MVVAAGGPKLETDADLLHLAYDVVQAETAGITSGRNIWESDSARGMVRALKDVVHNSGSLNEVMSKLTTG